MTFKVLMAIPFLVFTLAVVGASFTPAQATPTQNVGNADL